MRMVWQQSPRGRRSSLLLRKQVQAFAALPLMVVVAIPAIILYAAGPILPAEYLHLPGQAVTPLLGVIFFALGAALSAATVILFARIGRGTLAPWDSPKHLVVAGPYKLTRNPMITGVCGMLLGEALFFCSLPLLAWFGLFALANAFWIPLWEEPDLIRRFKDAYLLYKKHVPRWLPRFTPWRPPWEGGQ
jgi:protein-S-isoprenylcysteine O-methyltransferase Ste14